MGVKLKKGVEADAEAMSEAIEALGIDVVDDAGPEVMLAALRKEFDKRLADVDENDQIVCGKCGERTDDDPAISRCPFCGDEGSDEETAQALEKADEDAGDEDAEEAEEAAAEVIEGSDIDAGEDAEEPPQVDLDAAPADPPAPAAAETPKKGRGKNAKAETPAGAPADQPAAETPAAETPAAETPKKGRGKKAKAETPAAETPAAETPAAETPAAETPAAAEEAPKKGRGKKAAGSDLAKPEASAMAAELAVEDKKIANAQRDIVSGSYDLGVALRTVHEKELWKAAGHKTFTQYLAAKGIGRTFAYDLMELTQKFDRKTFEEVGRKKLMLVARVGGPETPKGQEALDAAKNGASVRQLEGKAGGTSAPAPEAPGRTRHTVAEHERGGEKPAAPPKDDRITLLAKVGSKPETFPFIDRKTRQPVKEWGAETFVEIKVANGVSQFLALKTDKAGKITGVTVAYRKIEDAAAAE